MQSIYDFSAQSLQGTEINFNQYRGKVLLIVNTASKCGFTPQLTGLEELNKKHKENGLEILGFPCDQFGHQEPGSDSDIAEGCVINYGVSFQMFSKSEVNGKNEIPLYTYLKSKKGGFLGKRIKWNFTKFLVNKEGKVVGRYAPNTTPEKMEADIKKLL
ncbi:MAG: glutathione peroxidase [Crocinitomicaceae bacterium]